MPKLPKPKYPQKEIIDIRIELPDDINIDIQDIEELLKGINSALK